MKFLGPFLFVGSIALGAGVAIACGDDTGQTPKCPALELYDIRNEDDAAAIQHEQDRLAIQADPGCVTGPGTASTATVDAGSTD